MKIKAKITWGVIYLFVTIIFISAMGLYYINRLSVSADNIIKANYESVEYTRNILHYLDRPGDGAKDSVESNMRQQDRNVTEPGEREKTDSLRLLFNEWRASGSDQILPLLRQKALEIQQLNMKAIVQKNEVAQETSRNASTYLIIIVSVFGLIAFTFIINFPNYIAGPIAQLTRSIKSIADRKYEERLQFDRTDEFGELADAFNQMAEKLDEYEHSNLAKLIFEKERIETIINRMTDPVIGLDETQRVIFINEQAASLLNIQPSQIVGHYAPDVAVENDLLRALIQNDELVNGSGSRVIKIAITGRENYFSKEKIVIKYRPIGEPQEKQIGQVILLKNITTFKERDLAKTNFIATVSHELKTPIASMQMCIRLLKDRRVGDMNGEQENILATLATEIERLGRITHELLDLSQAETGNLKLTIQASDPRTIIDHAVEAVRFHAERKHVRIDFDIDDDTTRVQADADKTAWVLVNLLTNAIRYSLENDRVVLKKRRNDSFTVFTVQDFGPGIEAKHLGKLFDKYYQIPGSVSGSGLGLAICKEFIEAQGGTITVISEWGKGSEFSFTLKNA